MAQNKFKKILRLKYNLKIIKYEGQINYLKGGR